jgi:hypothetical protein
MYLASTASDYHFPEAGRNVVEIFIGRLGVKQSISVVTD